MKRIVFLVVAAVMLNTFSIGAYAEGNYEILRIPCPEGEELIETSYSTYERLLARYADNKEPIALSRYYDGFMCAYVPAEYKEREIESFIAEETEFADEPNPEKEDTFPYYIMERLALKGVIAGDENGNALPYNEVTRAEATAMVMRTLGFGEFEDTESGFSDVSEDKWYAGVVAAARKMGIVNGVSDTEFMPSAKVTREQITVMAANAMTYAALKNTQDNMDELKDAAEISDWARDAYKKLAGCAFYDYADVNGMEMAAYSKAQQNALRWEIAQILLRIIDRCPVYPSQMAVEYGFNEEMPVIDGSTSTYPFTQAIYSTLFYNGYQHSVMPEKHSKSHASYQRLINGEVDAIIASVYPAEDIVQMAKDSGVELELIPIAYDAMIFFTNAENLAEGLTKEQISEVYVDNKYENWSELGGEDALLYPYCRNYDSGSHSQMQRHFLDGKDIHPDIRRESTSVAMADVLTDVMGSKTDEPAGYGLGYSIYYYYHNMNAFYDTERHLKLLSIDGVKPTDETIADGSYPLSNNTYFVMRADEPENSPARRLAEFMLTPAGQVCVELAGFGPLIKTE